MTLLCLALAALGCQKEPEKKVLSEVYQHLSPVTQVEALYPSMVGPSDTVLDMRLHGPEETPELIWVTGYRASMTDQTGRNNVSDELMCHNTLSFHSSVKERQAVFGSGSNRTSRLFTLSQGQSRIDFPEGFGIPAISAEPFMLQSQVLNLREERIGMQVRHRVKTQFVYDKKAEVAMRALTLIDFGITLEITDPQAEEPPSDPLSCAVDAGGNPTSVEGGKSLTSHWVVKPGSEKRTTHLSNPFPWDTTIHYISVHVHPYAQYLELYDLTADQSLFKANCEPGDDMQSLKKVDHYSSVEGIKVFKDHRYELRSHYNNTSGKDQTAMAFMFCYVDDPTFQAPDSKTLETRSLEFCSSP